MTEIFQGYNHNYKIGSGEFFFTQNLTNDYYPLLSTRKKRGIVRQLTDAQGLISKDAAAYVDSGTLYINGVATPVTGLSSGIVQLVGMGAYICIFPDKVYYNTEDPSDYGSMEEHYANAQDGAEAAITYQACASDGTLYGDRTVSATEPANPSNGQVWVDSGSGTYYEYSSVQMQWVEIMTVFTKITFSTQGQLDVKDYDGVTISGAAFDDLNGEKIIYAHGGEAGSENDWIVVVGLLAEDVTLDGRITVDRNVPDMNYVCEAQNRLWGCFYGNDGSQNLNEIYCCALGDFKNWNQFMGVSTDSWVASIGSDGVWTGAINYLGYPTFFKENVIHRIVISPEGAHRVVETECRGVQEGSWRSLAIVGETLYYKSRTDICAYQGGFPTGVSDALGDLKYYDAVAGAFDGKYYISMLGADENPHLFVFDTEKGFWIREDGLRAEAFCSLGDDLYCIDSQNRLMAMHGAEGTQEGDFQWIAESGILYYAYPDMKYTNRYNFRLKCTGTIQFFIEYDSSGEWISCGTISSTGTDTVTLPVRPRRCDHMRIRMVGTGDVKLYSIARILEIGSDY
jgi:hypothetical protein